MERDFVAYAKKSDCECGRPHDVPVEKVAVGSNILQNELEGFSPDYSSGTITAVGDNQTLELVKPFLERRFRESDNNVTYVAIGDNITSFNEKVLGSTLLEIPSETSLLTAVGSGTITDCVRYLAYRLALPFISIPTAPSMDGYASSISPCIIDGLKVSLTARAPIGICADTEIFMTAPPNMVAAGYGDLLGKFTCNMDWRLSHIINKEYFCEYTSSFVIDVLEECLGIADSLEGNDAVKNPDMLEKLMEGLIVSGLAISMIGYSRAASGAEHIISHFLEFKHLTGEYDHFFHGETVALGTWIMVQLYKKFFSMSFDELGTLLTIKDEAVYSSKRLKLLRSEYGKYAGPIEAQWNEKRPTLSGKDAAVARLKEAWKLLQEEVDTHVPSSEVLSRHFEKVGVPYRPKHFNFDINFIKRAVLCAKEMRTRYTLLSLLDDLFILEEVVDSVLIDL